jgi:hypothetical protein
MRLAVILLVLLASCAVPDENPARPSASSSGDAAAPPRSDGPPTTEDTTRSDAATPGSNADSGPPPPAGPPGHVRGLVGVGYGGLRITSRDGGKTWTSSIAEANGGLDDYNLLRAVAYANGKWLATGWSATTSTDGVTWTPLRRINEPGGAMWNGASICGLTEGLTSDGNAFYVACGQEQTVFRSTDGTNWTEIGAIGDLGGHVALAFREGMFHAYGDNKTSYRSSDGATWTQVPGIEQATFCEGTWKSRAACHDASWFDGAYFQGIWQSRVSRSTDGASFVVVHDDPSNNTLYQPRAIAEGWVAP